jgi:hypothetical protein
MTTFTTVTETWSEDAWLLFGGIQKWLVQPLQKSYEVRPGSGPRELQSVNSLRIAAMHSAEIFLKFRQPAPTTSETLAVHAQQQQPDVGGLMGELEAVLKDLSSGKRVALDPDFKKQSRRVKRVTKKPSTKATRRWARTLARDLAVATD